MKWAQVLDPVKSTADLFGLIDYDKDNITLSYLVSSIPWELQKQSHSSLKERLPEDMVVLISGTAEEACRLPKETAFAFTETSLVASWDNCCYLANPDTAHLCHVFY